ncbi:hypothetical protein ILYODFUR_032348 [Ilyodon furcidens]|uniref:Uncharacterized protein n=1 Tax=Ilyodon furcidens TaxID=33524 RepID=A0ABV0TNK8_9TELE
MPDQSLQPQTQLVSGYFLVGTKQDSWRHSTFFYLWMVLSPSVSGCRELNLREYLSVYSLGLKNTLCSRSFVCRMSQYNSDVKIITEVYTFASIPSNRNNKNSLKFRQQADDT